jgi:hypothetical protein
LVPRFTQIDGYTQDRRRQVFDFLVLAGQAVHIRGRAAEVGNDAGEALGLVADVLDLAQDRRLGTALDDAAFVLGDRAEGAAAEAAAHDVDREADHFPRRDIGIAVARVRRAGVGHVVDVVHLVHGQRQRRRVHPHVAVAVRLHQRARIAGLDSRWNTREACAYITGSSHGFKRRQAHHGLVVLFQFHGAALFAAHDADRLDTSAGGGGGALVGSTMAGFLGRLAAAVGGAGRRVRVTIR